MNSTTSTDKAKDVSRVSGFGRPKRHHKGGSLIGYLYSFGFFSLLSIGYFLPRPISFIYKRHMNVQ